MSRSTGFIALLVVLLVATATVSGKASPLAGNAPKTVASSSKAVCSVYSSAEALYEMGPLSAKTVSPVPVNCWVGACELYIWGSYLTKSVTSLKTCMGWDGPIRPWGPLGAMGPLGTNTISPAGVMKLIGNWEFFKQMYMNNTGPLDVANGPMSSAGPLGETFWTVMPSINDMTKHMMGMGIWSVLGPLGPLGALGGLGPLGPVGAHGYGADDNGVFLDKAGKVKRTVKAVYNSSLTVEWPLFESYDEDYASSLSQEEADTSFSVVGTASSYSPAVFNVTSREEQFLTILVVPTAYTHVFGIEAVNSETKQVIASSQSVTMANWIQMKMNSGVSKLQVRVKGHAFNNPFLGSQFRLYVVGSTKFMLRKPHIAFTGDYIKSC